MPGCGVCGKAIAYEQPTKDCEGCGATVDLECWRGRGCVACCEFEGGPFFNEAKGAK